MITCYNQSYKRRTSKRINKMYASLSLLIKQLYSLLPHFIINRSADPNVKFKKVQQKIRYVIQSSIFAFYFILSSMPVNLTWFTLHSLLLHSIARQCQRSIKTFKGFNPFHLISVMSSYQIQIQYNSLRIFTTCADFSSTSSAPCAPVNMMTFVLRQFSYPKDLHCLIFKYYALYHHH